MRLPESIEASGGNHGSLVATFSVEHANMGRTSDAREKLLGSALELVHQRSYASVGVQELCDHAGVKKGSFYHFFPSKRDLTLAVLDRLLEQVREQVFDAALTNTRSPRAALRRWIMLLYEGTCTIKSQVGHVLGCPIGNLAAELSAQEEIVRRKLEAVFAGLVDRLEAMLRDAMAAGVIPRQDARKTAQALLAYVEGLQLLAKASNDPEILRRLGDDYLWRLVQGAPPSPAKRTKPGGVAS